VVRVSELLGVSAVFRDSRVLGAIIISEVSELASVSVVLRGTETSALWTVSGMLAVLVLSSFLGIVPSEDGRLVSVVGFSAENAL